MQRLATVADKTGMTKRIKPASSAAPTSTLTPQTAVAAFALARPEIVAVPASAFVPTNLDMARAARRGLAVAERVERLHPALARLDDLDFRAVSNLRCYALAVLHVQGLVEQGGEASVALLASLLAEAAPLRELMLHSAETLALAGYVSYERVAAIRAGHGHADTAGDLQALGCLYAELWDRVRDKVPITRAMVERATTLSVELNSALGVREIDDDPLVEPSDPIHLRAQAFTLFVRAYDECRRGVSYLRWHQGDALVLVPSLYVRRSRKAVANELEGDTADDLADEGRSDVPELPLAPGIDGATSPAAIVAA
jgi:hypothetical protein